MKKVLSVVIALALVGVIGCQAKVAVPAKAVGKDSVVVKVDSVKVIIPAKADTTKKVIPAK